MNTFQKFLEADDNYPITSLSEFNNSENLVIKHYLNKSFHNLFKIECSRIAYITNNPCDFLKQDYSHGLNNMAISLFKLKNLYRWSETIEHCLNKDIELNIEVLTYKFCYSMMYSVDISLSLMHLEQQIDSIYNYITNKSSDFIGYLPNQKTGLQSIMRANQKLESILNILNRDPSKSSTAWNFMIEKGQVNSLYKILSQLTYIEATYREISPKEIISTL